MVDRRCLPPANPSTELSELMTDLLEAGVCGLPFLKVLTFNFRSPRTIQSQTFVGQTLWFRNKNTMNKKYIHQMIALENCFWNPRESEN